MVYTVRYKKKGQLFYRTVKKVKGDFIANDVPGSPRVLVLEDESRMEIPTLDTEFVFDSKRFLVIKSRMEAEAGTTIPMKPS